MLIFQAPKGARLKRYFYAAYVPYGKDDNCWWYYEETGKWDIYTKGMCGSSHFPCRTIRAFRRHLRKNPHMRGLLVLESRFVGHNVSSTKPRRRKSP